MPDVSAPAYDALRECARRRIDEEWELTGREQVVLRVIERLSFGCRQMKACVPRQALLGTACGLQRSEVCRVLGRLVRKCALSREQLGEETLYELQLHEPRVPRRSRVTEEDRDAAMEALIEVQENRGGGACDANGQGRLPGVLGPREDVDLEADALQAMLEQPAAPPAPAAAAAPRVGERVRPSTGSERPSAEEIERNLAALRARLGSDEEADPRALEVSRYRDGLSHEQQHLWDRLVREVLSGPEIGWQQFKQWAPKWRQRVTREFDKVFEAVGDHQLRRQRDGPAEEPGAWIYSQMQR